MWTRNVLYSLVSIKITRLEESENHPSTLSHTAELLNRSIIIIHIAHQSPAIITSREEHYWLVQVCNPNGNRRESKHTECTSIQERASPPFVCWLRRLATLEGKVSSWVVEWQFPLMLSCCCSLSLSLGIFLTFSCRWTISNMFTCSLRGLYLYSRSCQIHSYRVLVSACGY